MNFYRQLVLVEASFNRPANVTVYAAGDVMGTAVQTTFDLTNAARLIGGAGFISSITMIDSVNAATKLDADILIFSSDVTDQADNDAFAPTDGQMQTLCGRASCVGTDAITSSNNAAYNCIMPSSGKIDFVTVGSRDLFMLMVARNPYTPASGETFLFRFWINQA